MPREPIFDDGFAEMLPTPPSARMGDNQGPEWLSVGSELEEKLRVAHKKVLDRAKELLARADQYRAVGTPEDLKRATEFVRQLQEVLTVLEASEKIEKEPYRVAIGQIAGVLGDPHDQVGATKRRVEALMNAFNAEVLRQARKKAAEELAKKREEEEIARRRQAEADEEARKARAAAQKKIDDALAKSAAAAKPKAPGKHVIQAIEKAQAAERKAVLARDDVDDRKADVTRAERAVKLPAAALTRARSPNAVQSAQEFVDFRNLDRNSVDLEALRAHLSTEHLEMALRSYIGANATSIKEEIRNRRQPLRGVEFWINQRTRVGG